MIILHSCPQALPVSYPYAQVLSLIRVQASVSPFTPLKKTLYKSSSSEIIPMTRPIFPPYKIFSSYLEGYSFSFSPFFLAHQFPELTPENLKKKLLDGEITKNGARQHGPLRISFRPHPKLLIIESYKVGNQGQILPQQQLIEYHFQKDGQQLTLRWKLIFQDFFKENPALRKHGCPVF
jgi:hypothetical protein